jgi:hypothetical protein
MRLIRTSVLITALFAAAALTSVVAVLREIDSAQTTAPNNGRSSFVSAVEPPASVSASHASAPERFFAQDTYAEVATFAMGVDTVRVFTGKAKSRDWWCMGLSLGESGGISCSANDPRFGRGLQLHETTVLDRRFISGLAGTDVRELRIHTSRGTAPLPIKNGAFAAESAEAFEIRAYGDKGALIETRVIPDLASTRD